jgi:cystathionine beta-synthase
VHYSLFYTGVPGEASVYKVEGVGDDIVCDAFDLKAVDEIRQTDDRQAFTMARRLTREEGLFCGGSSGAIAHIAVQVARELGAGKKVVCVLPDHGSRYITKHLSDAWMKDYGFLEPERNLGYVEDVLRVERHAVVTASPETPLREVVQLFREHGVSQVPLVNGSGKPASIVHEVDLLRALQRGDVSMDAPASSVAAAVGGLVYPKARVEELYAIFAKDQVAIVVDGARIVGIVSQIDLIDYLSRKTGS